MLAAEDVFAEWAKVKDEPLANTAANPEGPGHAERGGARGFCLTTCVATEPEIGQIDELHPIERAVWWNALFDLRVVKPLTNNGTTGSQQRALTNPRAPLQTRHR